MSRFLKALAKVGLVELEADQARALEATLDPEEARRIVSEARSGLQGRREADPRGGGPTRSAGAGDAAGAQGLSSFAGSEPRSGAGGSGPGGSGVPLAGGALTPATGISEGFAFDVLYRGASVPPSPFPAEKLLKVLEGLQAMDPATRKAAILAMDLADDDWTIDDPILDAERKTRVLEGEKARLAAEVEAAEARSTQELETIVQYEQEASATIRQQIADLEALLARELTKGAEERAESQARVRATRDASAREVARMDQEIARLRHIALTFRPPSP